MGLAERSSTNGYHVGSTISTDLILKRKFIFKIFSLDSLVNVLVKKIIHADNIRRSSVNVVEKDR